MQFHAQLAARLCHGAQRGQLHAQKAQLVQHFVGVRHTAEGGRAVGAERLPELLLQDRRLRENDARAHKKVGVEDGQAVGVVHREGGDGAFRLVKVQIFHDGRGVGAEVGVALAHELGAAGRAGGRQQQRQLIIERIGARPCGLDEVVAPRGINALARKTAPLRRPEIVRTVVL